jgi:GATA-binding protein
MSWSATAHGQRGGPAATQASGTSDDTRNVDPPSISTTTSFFSSTTLPSTATFSTASSSSSFTSTVATATANSSYNPFNTVTTAPPLPSWIPNSLSPFPSSSHQSPGPNYPGRGDSWDSSFLEDGKLEPSIHDTIARRGLLRDSIFPDWKDGAYRSGLDSPDEMQKRDPLGTQIWKLYSRTKSQLPNQERMENLAWRMMAMTLKRREREQARLRYVCPFHLPTTPLRLVELAIVAPSPFLAHYPREHGT